MIITGFLHFLPLHKYICKNFPHTGIHTHIPPIQYAHNSKQVFHKCTTLSLQPLVIIYYYCVQIFILTYRMNIIVIDPANMGKTDITQDKNEITMQEIILCKNN